MILKANLLIFKVKYLGNFELKAAFLENGHDGYEFKLFPANIWTLKFCFLIVFAIKMLLDKPYGLLNLLEIKCDHLIR